MREKKTERGKQHEKEEGESSKTRVILRSLTGKDVERRKGGQDWE